MSTFNVTYKFYSPCDQDFDFIGEVTYEGDNEEIVKIQFKNDFSDDYSILWMDEVN